MSEFPELPTVVPEFFEADASNQKEIPGVDFLPLLERLITLVPNADTYFASLAKLYKARLKYGRILREQPIPTMEQVGPRGLLEFGKLDPSNLVAYLFWRKWVFDIDNRAAQETGYLFEPIIADAIGGTPASAPKSPVHRHDQPGRGRQVDCVKEDRAYEIKLRVTIAASGQGRWREELSFPVDCRQSGFVPVLVVLDATPNPKLLELCRAFEAEDGEVYVGEAAWEHLGEMAGPIMALFLARYVRGPLGTMLDEMPRTLPRLSLTMSSSEVRVCVGDETFRVARG